MRFDDAGARLLLRQVFDAAVAAADPRVMLQNFLPDKPKGRCVVIGCGKSAASMAASLEAAWPDVDLSGVVVTRYDHAVPTQKIVVLESSHPVPDANGEAAARRILAAVQGLSQDDLVIALISGGGSALMPLAAPGLTLADKQAVNKALLASGAAIGEMNIVRKHLSAIKGGRLAAACAPARVITLAISDVPGDDPAVIASGPTVVDPSTFADAREILTRYGIEITPAMEHQLSHGAETPKPGELPNAEFRMIATPHMALAAAADVARAQGVTPIILGDALEGESRELGIVMAGIARAIRTHGNPVQAPALLLSGGETTVSIGKGPAGRGGRNTECLLSLAVALGGEAGIWAVAGDTDGIDGTEDAAGAIVAPDTLARARDVGLTPRAVLAAHDSYSLFDAIGDLIRTGPTLTNVNDIRAILVA
ncbi:MAG: glycerate kinase [Acetobacteraceae bacterium]|nr:glycerate kinase [Acetobacteraceae bacterium]